MDKKNMRLLLAVDSKAKMVKHAASRIDKTDKMDGAGLQSLYERFNGAVDAALDEPKFPEHARKRVQKMATSIDAIVLKAHSTVQLALR